MSQRFDHLLSSRISTAIVFVVFLLHFDLPLPVALFSSALLLYIGILAAVVEATERGDHE